MSLITISALNPQTVELCAKYLVGGFDAEKNYYPPSFWFQSRVSWVYEDLCRSAWTGNVKSGIHLAKVILRDLIYGTMMYGAWHYEGNDYHFKLSTVDCQACLEFLKLEAIAQVID